MVKGWVRTSVPRLARSSRSYDPGGRLLIIRQVSAPNPTLELFTLPTSEFNPELARKIARKVIGRDHNEGKVQQTAAPVRCCCVADTNSRKFHERRKLSVGKGRFHSFTRRHYVSAEKVCVLCLRSQRFGPSPDGRDTHTLKQQCIRLGISRFPTPI